MTIKFDHLSLSPSAVVKVSWSNFKSFTPPSWNIIENFPAFTYRRLLESSIHNNVGIGSLSHQSDIVNCETISIRTSTSLEFEGVLSDINVDVQYFSSDLVVSWSNGKDFLSIPKDISLTRSKRNSLPTGVLESQLELSDWLRLTNRLNITS